MSAKTSLRALILMALVCGSCLGAQLSASDNLVLRSDSEKLTPEQVAQLLTTIADNQQKGAPREGQSDESYQRVYESVARLVRTMSQNNLSNMRRFVARLNTLVGGTPTTATATNTQREVSLQEESTQQILDRLDNVKAGQTDSTSIRQLNDDINKFISTLSDSYLRNIRRVIERMNKVIGTPSAPSMYANDDDFNNPNRGVGFPGWDELIVAFDRIQKSLAQFVRSSTRLATAGRR